VNPNLREVEVACLALQNWCAQEITTASAAEKEAIYRELKRLEDICDNFESASRLSKPRGISSQPLQEALPIRGPTRQTSPVTGVLKPSDRTGQEKSKRNGLSRISALLRPSNWRASRGRPGPDPSVEALHSARGATHPSSSSVPRHASTDDSTARETQRATQSQSSDANDGDNFSRRSTGSEAENGNVRTKWYGRRRLKTKRSRRPTSRSGSTSSVGSQVSDNSVAGVEEVLLAMAQLIAAQEHALNKSSSQLTFPRGMGRRQAEQTASEMARVALQRLSHRVIVLRRRQVHGE